jgi:hypothetical protein
MPPWLRSRIDCQSTSLDPKAAGIVQLFHSFLATLDLGGAAGHPYCAGAFLLCSIYLVVVGAWNMAD